MTYRAFLLLGALFLLTSVVTGLVGPVWIAITAGVASLVLLWGGIALYLNGDDE